MYENTRVRPCALCARGRPVLAYMSFQIFEFRTVFLQNNFDFDNAETNVSQALSMLSTCIDMIYDKEESWDASESTPQELNEFIDQLNTKQFKEVEEFFRTMPKLTHTLKVKNPKTGVESEVVLEGLVSFFS